MPFTLSAFRCKYLSFPIYPIWSIFFNHPRRPGAVCQCPECPMMNAVNEAVTIIFSARFLPQSAVSLPCLLQGVRGFVSSSAPTYFVVTLSLCLVCAGLVILGWARQARLSYFCWSEVLIDLNVTTHLLTEWYKYKQVCLTLGWSSVVFALCLLIERKLMTYSDLQLP